MTNVTFPKVYSGANDFTYMSLDCFHLSQKGYARGKIYYFVTLLYNLIYFEIIFVATNALWNNMLEPEGQKIQNWAKEFTEIKCPTYERPYIATRENS